MHAQWSGTRGYGFKEALHWFLLANWDGRYSGSAITSLNEDVRAIKEAESFCQALEALCGRLDVDEDLNAEIFLERYDRAGNRFLRLMPYLLLYSRGACDWVDGTRLGYDKTGSPITSGCEPQWHHIYPHSKLKKAGIADSDIHAVANITVLNEATNVSKLWARMPAVYIRKFGISADLLRGHLVPESFIAPVETGIDEQVKSQWAIDNYSLYLRERAELLARATQDFLAQLAQGQ